MLLRLDGDQFSEDAIGAGGRRIRGGGGRWGTDAAAALSRD